MTRRTVMINKHLPQDYPTIPQFLRKLGILLVLIVLSFAWVVSLVFGALAIITTSVAITAGTMGVALYHGKWVLLLACVFIISTLIIQAICRNTWKNE